MNLAELAAELRMDAAGGPSLVVLGCTTLYVVWFYRFSQTALEARAAARRGIPPAELPSEFSLRAFERGKYVGALLLGAGSLACGLLAGLAPSDLGLASPSTLPLLLGVAVLSAVFVPAAALGASRAPTMYHYPESRQTDFTPRIALRSGAAWAVYLLGYEILFRGVLLGGLLVFLRDTALAIVVMTALYVLAHLNKPAPETLSCLLMGPVFALLTLATGGVWAAWIVHVLIAVGSENAAARANPDVRWWGLRRKADVA